MVFVRFKSHPELERGEHGRVIVDKEAGKSKWRSLADLWKQPEMNQERDRPMFSIGPPGKFEDSQHSTFLNKERAHGWVRCDYCKKRRCLYKRCNLTKEDKERIERVKETLMYTCGSDFCTEEDPTITQDLVVVRRAVQCSDPMETQYYKDLRDHDPVCCICGVVGDNDLEVDEELSIQFQTVLPMCKKCKQDGKVPVHALASCHNPCSVTKHKHTHHTQQNRSHTHHTRHTHAVSWCCHPDQAFVYVGPQS